MNKDIIDGYMRYLSIVLAIFLSLYGTLAKPEYTSDSNKIIMLPIMPPIIKNLFKHYIFRVIVLSFIAYRANNDPQLSIVIAIAFISILNNITELEAKETFKQLEHYKEIEHFCNELGN